MGAYKVGEVVFPTARTASGSRWEVIEKVATDIEILAGAGGEAVMAFIVSSNFKKKDILWKPDMSQARGYALPSTCGCPTNMATKTRLVSRPGEHKKDIRSR